MYIETSAPRTPGQKAQLFSKAITVSSPICVNFFYHMYGPTIGALNIYIVPSGQSAMGQAAWTRKGNQQNQWTKGQISVNPSQQQLQVDTFYALICNP
ncbi:hypothetical protein DPMN_011682 [Dreissena polymorpha]|uniref:MAM domain-containing protein n=1 Tax=Dreissena polymorpha TaxID=45954 RepID=A0A9D4N5K4_DREPO|nr:hypothetical protein DPMN_011682 [Dreissena polymorpha]